MKGIVLAAGPALVLLYLQLLAPIFLQSPSRGPALPAALSADYPWDDVIPSTPAPNAQAGTGKKPEAVKGDTRLALAARVEPYLEAWSRRPILSHSAALPNNLAACPISLEHQSNPDQLNDQVDRWEALTPEELGRERDKILKGVREALVAGDTGVSGGKTDDGRPAGVEAIIGDGSKGIVVTGGNADTMARVMVMLRIVRNRHKSRLPIEVWAFDEELGSVEWEKVEQELADVKFRELPSKKIPGIWKNFQIKAEAINRSRFSQVLYLDSDNIPLVDPAFLFDSPVFTEYGIVLWPDITKDGPRNPVWRMMYQTCIPQDFQIDSGQILVDKRAQHGSIAAALLVAAEMQKAHEFWFGMTGGDKDTFRYALYALQLPWTRAPHWLSSAGGVHNGHFCGHTMFQYGLSPSEWSTVHPNASPSPAQASHAPPLFIHSNLLKHSGRAFSPGTTFSSLQRFLPSDVVARSNLDAMDAARGTVDKGDIMCVILSVDEEIAQAQGQGNDRPRIVEEDWNTAWAGVLKDFPAMFWEEGGKSGGFRI